MRDIIAARGAAHGLAGITWADRLALRVLGQFRLAAHTDAALPRSFPPLGDARADQLALEFRQSFRQS